MSGIRALLRLALMRSTTYVTASMDAKRLRTRECMTVSIADGLALARDDMGLGLSCPASTRWHADLHSIDHVGLCPVLQTQHVVRCCMLVSSARHLDMHALQLEPASGRQRSAAAQSDGVVWKFCSVCTAPWYGPRQTAGVHGAHPGRGTGHRLRSTACMVSP